jgi:predicted membrane protein
MKDFDALKVIWHNQISLPKVSHEDVFKKIRKTKSGLAKRLLIEIIGMCIAATAILSIWWLIPFNMWTTHLAIIVFLACCLYYIIAIIGNYQQINYDKLINKPEDYINHLKSYKEKRYVLNTRKYRLYSIFLSIGFLLYFIEISFLMPIWLTILALVLTFSWIAYSYFYLMRIYIKREESKLESMINNLERIQKQFEDNDL